MSCCARERGSTLNRVAAVHHRVSRSDLAYRTDPLATDRDVSKTETNLVASKIGRIALKTSRVALKIGRSAFKTEINLGWTSGSAEFGATLVLETIETIPEAIASIRRITLSSVSLRRGGCAVALIM